MLIQTAALGSLDSIVHQSIQRLLHVSLGYDSPLAGQVFWLTFEYKNNTIIGACCDVTSKKGVCLICNVATDPRVRRRGLATALLRFVLEHCRKNGWYVVRLSVRMTNEAAQRVYQQLGFRVESTNASGTHVIMGIDLSPPPLAK